MPIMTRRSKKLLYAGLAGAGIAALILAGGFLWIQKSSSVQHNEEVGRYLEKINELESFQTALEEVSSTAWVPLRNVPAGELLNPGDLEKVMLPQELSPDNLPNSVEELAGKGAKIELRKGTPITMSMLFDQELTPADLRNREMKSIWIPSNLQVKDTIDIRIQFPTGQDYIVLSKKRVDRLAAPAFWTTLSEQEILLLSSAMVDAYLNKASLYALTYVEPELQQRPVANYPPKQEVHKLIKNNPNIVFTAERQLESTLRAALEQDLSRFNELGSGTASTQYAEGKQDFNTWSAANPENETFTSSEPDGNEPSLSEHEKADIIFSAP
ncbi:SAF domain-containing protein [Paenibacillus lemnae]|uniref:Flagellar biosynthesis protein FlgA n=1 Tax=Paenibacillus lemnae TaxID=1330551 RepID=A0A848M5S4_PAELE|nr:SAF domain-containing protein [Paenibacillus lemnae]NMO95956.1 flagellar biosynthesis protein FlgA [Paenibacillus lemnae]